MLNSTILCIHEKENDNEEFFSWLKSSEKEKFKDVILVTDDIGSVLNCNCEIISPFQGQSGFSFILSGIFFSSTEKNLVVGTGSFPFDMKKAEILLKNLHSAVDSAMFFHEGKDMNPFFASYSKKIFNKFKASSGEDLEKYFLKRLKINRIRQ